MKSILNKIEQILTIYLESLTLELEKSKREYKINKYYEEIGQQIEEISDIYSTSYEDALIIYKAWSEGVLTKRRPSQESLKNYAEFTASDECWWYYRDLVRH